MLYLYLSSFNIYIYKFYPWSVAIEIPLLFRGLVVPRSVVGRPSFNKRICHKGPWQHDPYGMAIWFENPKPLVAARYGKKNTHHESTSFLGQTTVFTVFFPHFLVCLPHSKPRAELRCWCSSCLVWTNES
jgi:hypothetical protein